MNKYQNIIKKINNIFAKKYKISKVVALLLVTVFALKLLYILFFADIKKEVNKGRDSYDFDLYIANKHLLILNKYFENYKKKYDTLPLLDKKFFYNKIKNDIKIDEVYVYYDSLLNDKQMNINMTMFNWDYQNKKISLVEKEKFINSNKLFLGMGHSENYIVYKRLSKSKFQIYFVGKNGIDDDGYGDDVLLK
jgi:hypothetical protein